ncbi:tRNA(Met) cytidine acetyltransferase [Rodentibacter trehalosifermentans]|uniref:tRNA(Met) cytidine acetyltransferase TmcA n=1 Tax=Rodentibacter trehalosifermentans TaxID=1908263 RepID=A0A1V3IZQ1_9PAST|nr:GNAT family N-acetyltransferase [Rodentibacter trehalosifermentans]OOF44963.1 tRNA(Met) cytidine acetyltransferase [Rodentibacter trehalosifermentans]OOF47982.1 tRNA(Met) cytidine acetyltransferase [Rodentibacter trehalosifermentans]
MLTRQCQVLISDEMPSFLPPQVLIVGEQGIPFSKAANLLGQEFEHILFDARAGIHLEALAIAAGTLKRGGHFCLLLSTWEDLEKHPDMDSLRWNGNRGGICTPNFIQHFKQCLARYRFPILRKASAVSFPAVFHDENKHKAATLEQQQIIEAILQRQSDLYFLTAKRGRGKSALLGMLADCINTPIYLTAPNKSAVNTLYDFAKGKIEFIAPDELSERLQKNAAFFDKAWLLVDEAAMIPLSLLQQFSQHFRHIVFSTTIHSYEGTGRGFELKFKQKTHRTFQQFELDHPLRWEENDPLEHFIEDLLLLDAEDKFEQIISHPQHNIQISEIAQDRLIRSPEAFYGLMTLAHYRTSPIDLRRLFDGEGQHFYLATERERLIGAIWALEEGGMNDEALIKQIQQGKRRPRGNLVPQALCFHSHFPQACRLRSLRISRIAVQPYWQQQGIGQALVENMQKSAVDFLSVSFGYTKALANFWQKSGFVLVHLGEHLEASSGCYSAIALKGISEAGRAFTEIAQRQFQRDLGLSTHPLAESLWRGEVDWSLNEEDWQRLKTFAYFHRTLFSSTPAIRRLLKAQGEGYFPQLSASFSKKPLPFNKKKSVECFRLEIKQYLIHQSLNP